MLKLNYRFSTSEIREMRKSISQLLDLTASVEEFANLNTLIRNSLIQLLDMLFQKPELRNVQNELSLFELGEDLSNAYRALCMVERIRLLYSSLMCPFPELNNVNQKWIHKFSNLLIEWYFLYCRGEAEKVAKFQSVACFNKIMGVEPPSPIKLPFGWIEGSLSPSGTIHRRVVLRMKREKDPEEKLRMAQCFLYFKKGCPKASPSFIAETLDKHKKALGTSLGKLEGLYGETVLPLQALKRRLKKIVEDVFSSYRAPRHWWDPSNSASFLTSQKKGGQAGDVEFVCEGWDNIPFHGFGPLASSDNWEFHDTGYSVIKVPITVTPCLRITKDIRAKPVALTEPLKVRVITCEDAWITYALKGAQMSLWKCLKDFPWFSLTGRPVQFTDIPLLHKGEKWISVDYSAATDCLHSGFSQICIKEICRVTGLPYELCKDSLINHRIVYKDGQVVDQKNGQLMGSILSFIVLCICNAAVLSLSVDPDKYRRDSHILVNGDDGLFVGGEKEYGIWKAISSHVGLSPSVGKVYFSDEFCVINSQAFTNGHLGVCEVPYPNAAGMMQFDARTYSQPKLPLDLREAQQLWLSGFREYEHRESAKKLWYRTFRGVLSDRWVNDLSVSYTLPISFGGLGLEALSSAPEPCLSRLQIARCRQSLEGGKPYGFLPTKRRKTVAPQNFFKEIGGTAYVFAALPLSEDSQEVTALRRLGFKGRIEEGSETVDDCFGRMIKKSSIGSSSFSTAVLNGCRLKEAVPLKRDLLDLRRAWALFGKKGSHFWCRKDDNHPIFPSDLNPFSVGWRSAKINPYLPRIPDYDPLWGRHYHKFLESLEQVQDELRISNSPDVISCANPIMRQLPLKRKGGSKKPPTLHANGRV